MSRISRVDSDDGVARQIARAGILERSCGTWCLSVLAELDYNNVSTYCVTRACC